jgi:hypothetical protein
MIVPSQLALKTHTNLGCAASFATLDKLVDKFTLPPAALPIGDASLTHVIKLAAHLTTSPTPTAMRQYAQFCSVLLRRPYSSEKGSKIRRSCRPFNLTSSSKPSKYL